MSKLPISEHFLSVGKYQAKTRVVFKANIFLLNWAPGPPGVERLLPESVLEGELGGDRSGPRGR